MKQLLITIVAVVLVGCGEPATNTGKTDVQSTGKKQEAELATFLPGKRIYFSIPMPGDPGVPIEPAEPEPKLFSDEPEVETGKKPTPPEIVWQFQKDGTIAMGVFSDVEVEFFEGQNMSYKVNGVDVEGFEDGKEGGGMTFSSANPKKGDKVLIGEKGQEKIQVTITRIEEASFPHTVSNMTTESRRTDDQNSDSKTHKPIADLPSEDIPETSIHEAAKNGDISIVKQHLDAGVDINLKDKTGETPLHHAASSGHLEMTKLLISKGANVDARNSVKWTPLHWSIRSPLSNKLIIETLIASGADINTSDSLGQSPLHTCESAEIADLLLKNGAVLEKKCEYGRTPLIRASKYGYTGVVKILLEKGANAKFNEGASHEYLALFTALQIAENKEIGSLLIKYGADVNSQNDNKDTPLHNASKRGDIEFINLLLKEGAKINIISTSASKRNAGTALDVAIKNKREEAVALLRKHGGKTSEELKAAGN